MCGLPCSVNMYCKHLIIFEEDLLDMWNSKQKPKNTSTTAKTKPIYLQYPFEGETLDGS